MTKSLLFYYIEKISYNMKLENSYEELWKEIRKEIINSSNFQFEVLIGDLINFQKCVTVIGSSILKINKK